MAKSRKAVSTGLVKVTVGQFGSIECKCILVDKGTTVDKAFSKAGYSIHSDEDILTIEGKSVKQSDVVKKDATYLLHTKYKSGSF